MQVLRQLIRRCFFKPHSAGTAGKTPASALRPVRDDELARAVGGVGETSTPRNGW